MALRPITFRVNFATPWYNTTNAVDLINNTLTNQGWNVIEVQMLDRVFYPTQAVNYLVIANVSDTFDEAGAARVLQQVLNTVGSVYFAGATNITPQTNAVNSTNPENVYSVTTDPGLIGGLSLTTILLIIVGIVILKK